jgi:hypothetical protein
MLRDQIKPLHLICGLLAAALLASTDATPAGATSGPVFRLYEMKVDTVLPGEEQARSIVIQNVGDTQTSTPVQFTDTTSSGLTGPEASSETGIPSSIEVVGSAGPAQCHTEGQTLLCVLPGPLPPGAQMVVSVRFMVEPQATGVLSESVDASGGGSVGTAHFENRSTVGSPEPFAFTAAAVTLLNPDGSQAVQAASDPADYTTTLRWTSYSTPPNLFGGLFLHGVAHPKDVVAHLPPGLVGNPSAVTECTAAQLGKLIFVNGGLHSSCPPASQVGIARVILAGQLYMTGLYNMVAPYGVATELGFEFFKVVVLLQADVRPGDNGIDVYSRDTSTTLAVNGVDITAWGDPSDPSHDRERDYCIDESTYRGATGMVCSAATAPKAFLRYPTSCSGKPLDFSVESNSYEHPEEFAKASMPGPIMVGCPDVPFSPSITVEPTGTETSSPTGVSVKVTLPQNQNPDGLATSDLKKAVVTLPEGMAINPSAADGLQVCDDAHLHLDSNTPAECPDGSKMGTVTLHTQLIANPIEGTIFLRPQNSSDPMSGEMFRVAFELRDDSHGLDFKLSGHITANPTTGRLTTTFDDNPQLPFEDIVLHFKSGARAPLVTPASCQVQTTEVDLYPWARPEEAVHRATSFQLTAGPLGTPCPEPGPFNPGFIAGVTNVEAGSFTSFLTTFSRQDADQPMQRVSVQLPKGLSGSLAELPLCPEPQASLGTCSSASEIGTMTSGAGAGPTPYYVTGGRIYMTGPYEGAPFGLSMVVPAKAGPFDLGTVIVRAKVEVDIHTAQLTVTTDPLPQVVGGVPVDLRLVNVTINRPNFVFNPTNCANATMTGTMTSGKGATAVVSKAFQVTNCAALKFHPKFTVSTSGKTSRTKGASLDAKLSYPRGHTVNIAKVKVSLPKQLPSRLTTLQKACTAATFQANPAACPAASRIGTAVANTPVLPAQLSGPAYFVSHGGEAFPDLVVVLQGYGVTVDLVGTTFINEKTNITSTTFNQVPDVPVGSFELKLPQGPNSALAAIGNLCTTSLKMPTAFVAQDGAEIHQSTPIAVTGCTKHKSKPHHHKKGKKK